MGEGGVISRVAGPTIHCRPRRDPVDYRARHDLAEVELTMAHYLGAQDASPRRTS
ncbi:PemK family transcriptional regulator [Knoellia sinensis KCTC 19936]|uniref:PemK family transcriptional regulator n=1 Tax=Knoellia sinensis KCTC 19936 TaxID=1385520 RepID=A0A0A0J0Y0_9MICO|nr:PemK family transcriptional regulator [Knoellia sinensis KCTC 19936]